MSAAPMVPLEELMATRLGGVDPSKFADETFELYSIPAYDSRSPEVVAGEEIGSTKQIVKPRDVLLSKIVPHIRRSWIVGTAGDHRQIASGEWIVFRSDNAAPEYLRHVLLGDDFHAQFMQTVSGVGGSLLRARPAQVAKIRIPLPLLPEQRRIAAILDKADALRTKRREALAQLDHLAQSIFVEMFGDPVTNPKGISKQTLASIAEIGTGSTPSRAGGDFYEGTIPWIKTTEVVGEEIFDTEEKLTEDGLKAIRGKLHPENSIVVAMYGQGQTRGRCGLLRVKASCNQACGVIKPSHHFDSLFMFQQLQMAYERLRALGRGGNQENLNLQLLGGFEVLVPHKEMQMAFVARLRAINNLKGRHLDALKRQDALFASLQHRAFSGEL